MRNRNANPTRSPSATVPPPGVSGAPTAVAEPGTREAAGAAGPLTHEDLDRAADRWAVRRARASRRLRPLWLLWLFVGPGVLVFLGENDAPSMVSYATSGGRFGIGFFLPVVVLPFAMAFVIQEITMRLGAVTHRGHAELIFDRFGTFWGGFAMADLVLGNFLTLATEFVGIRAGASYFGVRPAIAVGCALLALFAVMLTGRYWTWERLALGLAAFNLLFIPVALMAHPPWKEVGHALLTWSPLPQGRPVDLIVLIVSDLGATVTPWMIFFQQSAVVDKGEQPRDIAIGRVDTMIGMGLAAVCGLAAALAATPLFVHGLQNSPAFQNGDFAQALRPWIGNLGAELFALGLLEAGLLAAITISTSSAYAFGEVLNVGHSLNWPLRKAWPFYLVLLGSAALAGGLVLIPRMPLVAIVLIVNVLAALEMPPALIFLLLLVNDRELMGDRVNSFGQNFAAIAVAAILVLCGLAFAVVTLAS